MQAPRLTSFALSLALASLVASSQVSANVAAARESPQDNAEQARIAASIGKYQAYLARKPYNSWAFDKLVEAAVSTNRLAAVVESYEQLQRDDPQNAATRVILARLYARSDQGQEARELLAALEEKDAQLWRLLGELYSSERKHKEAVQALEEALRATEDLELLAQIHEQLGEALLAAGERERAARAFQGLAELKPTDFNLRLDAAAALARHGLHAEALVQFSRAEELAADDTPRRCRVLSEIGRLQEQRNFGAEAIATYRKATALMGRGNWLKRDLRERILSIHKRAGTLADLIAVCASEATAAGGDLDAREFHARALAAAGHDAEARNVLRAATKDFAADMALSRQLIGALERLEDVDGVVAEYQRILGEHPDELELYLELGRVFASEGRLEQAKLQWARTLEEHLDDAGTCVRLAGFYTLYDMVDEAVGMYERAIKLEPANLRHYTDLCATLAVHERRPEVTSVIESAAAAAAGNAGRLQELAGLWREYGELERATAALETALGLDGANLRLKRELADLLIETGASERASEMLHAVIEGAKEAALRKSCIDRLLRLFDKNERLDELIAIEQASLAEDPTRLAPALVLGKAYVRSREPDRALATYELLLTTFKGSDAPGRVDARENLVRLYEELGEHEDALAQLAALMSERPQQRRRYLKEKARIHLQNRMQEEAFACYDEILSGAPDNAAAFKEVAQAYEKLGLLPEAIECMQQAVRLRPAAADMRLDLAGLLRDMGELDKAEREYVAAIASASARGGSASEELGDARKEHYQLLSESGRLEDEIGTLRSRIAANPYDTEAPLALTDIYVRELEYQLALDMLDRLIGFQPKEARLLRERARVYVELERFADAISDFETLWKLPGSDRVELSFDIADAALGSGDRRRAAQVLAGIDNSGREATLYARHDLADEVALSLERGLARNPSDGRLAMRLARSYEKLGRVDDALEVLEGLRAQRGESWRLLKKIGDLYQQQGQMDKALAIGERLFASIRLPADEGLDVQEENQDSRSRYVSSYRYSSSYLLRSANRYQSRLNELQTYFKGKGLQDEFDARAQSELRLRPANTVLLSNVLSSLRRAKAKAPLALEMLSVVHAGTVAIDRIPPGYSALSWESYLAGRRIYVYSSDPEATRDRIAALQSRRDAAGLDEEGALTLAKLQLQLRDEPGQLATLSSASQKDPDSIALGTALALTLGKQKKYAQACAELERLLPLLDARPPYPDTEENDKRAFDNVKRSLLEGFPLHIRRRVNDAALQRLRDIGRTDVGSFSWGPGTRQTARGARRVLATYLLELDRDQEARALLDVFLPDKDEQLAQLAYVGRLYYAKERFKEAELIYRRLLLAERALESDPLLGFNRQWVRYMTTPMKNLARILELREEWLESAELLRNYGEKQPALLMLQTAGLLEAAEQRYRERMSTEGAALDAQPEADTTAWRDAAVQLADVLEMGKRWDELAAVYEELVARDPADFPARECLAALHERAGRIDEAIHAHRDMIVLKRELNRTVPRKEHPERRHLEPTPPLRKTNNEDWTWNNLRNSSYGNMNQGRRQYPLRNHYVAVLKLHLDRREISQAADVLRELARSDTQTFFWLGYSLRSIIEDYQLGSAAIPILRMLHGAQPNESDPALAYAGALVLAKRFDEARRIYERLVNRTTLDDWDKRRVRDALKTIDARLGVEGGETLASVREEVREDPKNAKLRFKYARLLFEEREHKEALVEARVAEELAPHLDEIVEFTTSCIQLLGHEQELEERLLHKLERDADESARFQIAVRLANWKLAESPAGSEPDWVAIDALFTKATKGSKKTNYSSAMWYVGHGYYERATELLRGRYEDAKSQVGYSLARERANLENALLIAADIAGVLDLAWEAHEDSQDTTTRGQLMFRVANLLRGLPDLRGSVADIGQVIASHEGERRMHEEAGLALALGSLASCEAILAAYPDRSGEMRYLYPSLVLLARENHDLAGALAYLEDLESKDLVSDSGMVGSSVGSLSERQLLQAEMGSLLHAMGDLARARARWTKLYEEDDKERHKPLSLLYAEHELFAEASAELRLYLAHFGERQSGDLILLADYEAQQEHHSEALDLLKRASVLAAENERELETIEKQRKELYRKAGRAADYIEELRQRHATDPDDHSLGFVLATTLGESGDLQAANAMLEKLSEHASMKQQCLPLLSSRALARGDREGAVLYLQQLLAGNVDEWMRSQHARTLSGILNDLDREEEAFEVLMSAYEDRESLQALQSAGNHFIGKKQYERALLYLQNAWKLKREDPGATSQLLIALKELERYDEARPILEEFLNRTKQATRLGLYGTHIAEIVRASGLLESLEEQLAQQPTDKKLLRRSAMIAQAVGEHESELEHCRALLAVDPDDRFALHTLTAEARRIEDWDSTERMLRHSLVLADRETGVLQDRWGSSATSLRESLMQVYMLQGQEERALALWDELIWKRHAQVDNWRYAINSSSSGHYRLADPLWKHGFHDRYFEELKRGALQGGRNSNRGHTREEQRYQAGERSDELLEVLWGKLIDPLADFLAGQRDPYSSRMISMMGYSGNRVSLNDPSGLLVRIYVEEGRVDELLARLVRERELLPKDAILKNLHRQVLERAERWKELQPFLEEEIAEGQENAAEHAALSANLRKQGDLEGAITSMTRAVELTTSGSGGRTTTYNNYSSGPQHVRFQWAGRGVTSYGGGFSSSTSYGFDSQQGLTVYEQELMGLYLLTDREDEAQAIEKKLHDWLDLHEDQARWTLDRIGTILAGLDLAEHAERYWLEAVEEVEEQIRRTSTFSRLVILYERLENDGKRDHYLERYSALYDEFDPEDENERRSLISLQHFLADHGPDPGAALERLLALKARDPDPLRDATDLTLAWTYLRAGKFQQALDVYELRQSRERALGTEPSVWELYGRGLALAEVKGIAAARRTLMLALAIDPNHREAANAWELLE